MAGKADKDSILIQPVIQNTPSLARFPEGESFPEAQARVVAELDTLRSIHKGAKDVIACVCHADPIKLAIAHYIGLHLDFFQRPRRRQMELIGTAGVILVEFASWGRCTVSVYSPAGAQWEREALGTARDDMFAAEDRAFLEAVADDTPVPCDIHEAAKSIRVIEQAAQHKDRS